MYNAARYTASHAPVVHFANHDSPKFGFGNGRLAARAAELFEFVRRLGGECFHEVGGQALRVGLAETDWQHQQAHALVERQYRRSGFLSSEATLPHANENELVVVAMEGMMALGTVTLRMDQGSGLLADGHYRREINAFREGGAQVCEFSRFAIDSEMNVLDIVDPMLQVACAAGFDPDRPTEVFVECHPRHAAFYRRVLGFKVAGEETICERVGAPAVLLQAPLAGLTQAPALVRRREQHVLEAQQKLQEQQESEYFVPCPAMA